MNQGFWTGKDARYLSDGEMAYDNSPRIEHKRSHQWYMDGPETDLYPNKKQAVEVPTTNFFSRVLNSNMTSWENASSFHPIPGQFPEQLYDAETARAVNFDDQSMPPLGAEKVDMDRKVKDDLFSSVSSFGLSMSQMLQDPRYGLNYEGIRKVKVSQVKDSENVVSASLRHAYNRVDNDPVSSEHAYNKVKDSNISIGLAYFKGDHNIMSIGETYERENSVFMAMGQSYNKQEESGMTGQTFSESNNTIVMSNTFDKSDSNFMSTGQSYNRMDDSSVTMGHTYSKGDDSAISIGYSYNKGDNNRLSIGKSYNKGDSTIIHFGGYDDDDSNPSGKLISAYDLLMGQPVQESDAPNEKALIRSSADVLGSFGNVTSSGAEVYKKKEESKTSKTSKKVPSNNFPSNVRSLLSTGMLDGVPVKYIAWSREKELRGVIKSSGYQCGCQTCNFSKVINAYEFERHAGCKTKHPNNHIYFESGKTIYGIVQELRSTPQNILFDVIQTITGSPINQKSFQLWKDSFLAATRELQRIYGTDDDRRLLQNNQVLL